MAPIAQSSVDSGLIGALSELAASVQRGRTTGDVLRIASEGVDRLGMRFFAFQIDGDDLVLRCLKTTRARSEAIERMIGRELIGLRAPITQCGPAAAILAQRKNVYREDMSLFVRFVEAATGADAEPLDASPSTSGTSTGVLAPLFVRDEPWGLLGLLSPWFREEDAAAVALFATHVGSSIEVAEFILALQRTQQELIARERLATIGELAATVAHEVRNPLGVLFNSVASLRRIVRDGGGPKARSDMDVLLSILSEEANRLNAIVTDLLEFARPQAMRTQGTLLDDVLREVASSLPTIPEEGATEVRLEPCPELPPVEIDPRLVRQAVLNLMLNALQAMPRGGTLTVRTRLDDTGDRAHACIDVSDTGDGIPPEHKQRVFEPFFTTKATGTGLGLAVVKRVVEAHQGELDITTSAEGTTFTIRLPLKPGTIPPPPKSEPRLRRSLY